MAFGIVTVPLALSINETLPAGGGLLADMRIFTAMGAYSMGVTTAVVPSDGPQLGAAEPLSAQSVGTQLRMVLEHYSVGAVKLGPPHSPEAAEAVGVLLQAARQQRQDLPIVVNSSLRTRTGQSRADAATQAAAMAHCYPLASLLVCNVDDAALLTKSGVTTPEHLEPAAKTLHAQFGVPVLVTGGRLANTDESVDCLWNGSELEFFASTRILGISLFGLSDALTAVTVVYLANGFGVADSVAQAKTYLEQALAHALP